MNGTLSVLFLSLGLAVSPVPKTEINAVDIVKQEVQMQTERSQSQAELISLTGDTDVTVAQMVKYFEDNNGQYPHELMEQGGAADLETFCRIYLEEAKMEDIKPEVAFAQAMKETGWLQFGGDVQPEQFNFAGLGTTGGGVPGHSFPDVRTGVRAQIQHLKAYATDAELVNECVDQRYAYVVKGSAPYVEWLGQQENPNGFGWAVAADYGETLALMVEAIQDYEAE